MSVAPDGMGWQVEGEASGKENGMGPLVVGSVHEKDEVIGVYVNTSKEPYGAQQCPDSTILPKLMVTEE
jgi:hypothetical protein